MKLERPIVFIDLETTGLDLANDRIIEISMVKITPTDNDGTVYTRKINPEGRIITPEAFGKHGIKLEDLVICPTFKDLAEEIYDFIKGCDLGGYNCRRFDIPILIEEFLRADIPLNIKDFKIVDVYKIFIKAEPKTLEGTYKRFFGEDLEGAHSAEADIFATIKILEKLEELYPIPKTPTELDNYAFADEGYIDLENKLRKQDNFILFNFGKHKDKTIQEVFRVDPGYYEWIIHQSDMTQYTKRIFQNILNYLKKS